jgi:hypothetical protein
MNINTILKAANPQELRSLGSYGDVKNTIEHALDISLGVNSWASLFEKLRALATKTQSDKEALLSACNLDNQALSQAKICELLEIKIHTNDHDTLNRKVERIIELFQRNEFDPHEYYEKTKLQKFKHSSRLEGIEIATPSAKNALNDVLKKYSRPARGEI